MQQQRRHVESVKQRNEIHRRARLEHPAHLPGARAGAAVATKPRPETLIGRDARIHHRHDVAATPARDRSARARRHTARVPARWITGTAQQPRMRGEQHEARHAIGVLYGVVHAQPGPDRDAEVHHALTPRGIHDRLEVAHLILERRAAGRSSERPVPTRSNQITRLNEPSPRRKPARYGSSHAKIQLRHEARRKHHVRRPGAERLKGDARPARSDVANLRQHAESICAPPTRHP